MGRRRGPARAGFICGRTACARVLRSPRCQATSGKSGYGQPLGRPDRPPGSRVAAPLGPRRAADPGDGGAEVLLPGEGCARPCGSSRCSPPPSRAPGQARGWERLGAGGVCLFASPAARRASSLLCFRALAGAESCAARMGRCGLVSHRFRSGVGREVWVHGVCFYLVDTHFVGLPYQRGCAQCVRTLNSCYFRRSWVFLTFPGTVYVRDACAGCLQQHFWPRQASVGGGRRPLSDLVVRQENGFLWL